MVPSSTPRLDGRSNRSPDPVRACLARLPEPRSLPPPESTIRFFASSHQLHQLTPRTLILCALFLVGVVLQGITGIVMHHLGPGWTPASVAAHYRGNEAPTASDDSELHALFSTGSPDPAQMPKVQVARSFGTLMEVAHFHLVAMPLLIFVVAHLFSMTPWGRSRWAGLVCYGGFTFALVDILTPFAVRYVSAGFAPLKLAAFIGLECSLIGMALGVLIAGMLALHRIRHDAPGEA